jgi:hypothetical protein
MRLSEVQREFSFHIACLIQHIYASGNECTFGDAYRDPRAFGEMHDEGPYGRGMSAHKQRLAVDLNLYIDGEYQTTSAAHRPYAEYWEALHEDNVSGINFNDANHYSRRFGGIA